MNTDPIIVQMEHTDKGRKGTPTATWNAQNSDNMAELLEEHVASPAKTEKQA